MKKVLLIGKRLNQKIFNFISNYAASYNEAANLEDLKRIYSKNSFDICIVFDNYKKNQFDTIIDYMVSKSPEQYIIVLQKNKAYANCYNKRVCAFCSESNNIVTVLEPFTNEYIIGIMENFKPSLCQSLIRTQQTNSVKFIKDFKDLDTGTIKKLINISKLNFYEKDSVISYDNDKNDKIYYLLSGCVNQSVGGKNFKNISIKTISKPTFLIQSSSLYFQDVVATFHSVSSVYLLEFDKNEFFKIAYEEPELMIILNKLLIKEIEEYKYIIWKNCSHDTLERVCLELINNETVLKYKNKSQLSNELNMTQETLSRLIRKLKNENILDNSLNLVDKNSLYKYVSK